MLRGEGNVVPSVKALVGAPAYLMSLVKELARYEPSRVKLVIDDEEIISDAFMVLIANVSDLRLRRCQDPRPLPPSMTAGWTSASSSDRRRTPSDSSHR